MEAKEFNPILGLWKVYGMDKSAQIMTGHIGQPSYLPIAACLDRGAETDDNARLLAAAPALLVALEWTLEQLNTLTTEEYSRGGDKVIRERLQKTIAKARVQA